MFSRLLAAALVGLAFLAAPLAAGAEDSAWTPFRNDAYGVATSFPGAPKVTVGDPSNPRRSMKAAYEISNTDAMMLTVDFLGTTDFDAQAVLEAATQGAIKGGKVTLISRRSLQLPDGAIGNEFIAGPNPDNLYARVWIIIKGDRMVLVLASAAGAPPSQSALFDDLQLLEPVAA